MSDFKLTLSGSLSYKYIFIIFLYFFSYIQICFATDSITCKANCAYSKTECLQVAKRENQLEKSPGLDDGVFPTGVQNNAMLGQSSRNNILAERRLERASKCDAEYSKCSIQCNFSTQTNTTHSSNQN